VNETDAAVPRLPPLPAAHPDRRLVGWVVAVSMAVALAPPLVRQAAGVLWPVKRRFLDEPWPDRMRLLVVEGVCIAGVFFIGATLGSFLNVVVHRLPRGRSPLQGRSHCPACGHQIRARDNVPILGWLRLGGRCRDCGVLIAARYPIVEAVCGGLVLLLFTTEWLSGGANIPVRPPSPSSGLEWITLEPRADLVGLFLFHAATLLTLLVWMLVAADGGRLSARHVARMLAIVTGLTVVWPRLHPVPVLPGAPSAPAWLVAGLAVAVVGMAVGGLLGALAGRFVGQAWWPPAALALWGAACGWQAAVGMTLLWAALAVLDRWAGRFTVWLSLPAPWLCLAAAVIHVVGWRALHVALGTW